MKQLTTYIVACLWCWATLIPLQAQGLKSFLSGGVASGSDYTVNTAVFDGTNDYIRGTTNDTGFNDTTGLTVSYWIKPAGDGTTRFIFSYGTSASIAHLESYINTSNQLRLRASTSASAAGSAVDLTSSITVPASGGWRHVAWFVDTTSSANTQLYVDGTEDSSLTETTLTGTIDLTITGDRSTIGGNPAGSPSQLYNGAMAEVWVNDVYLDPSTNLSKFISGGGPVSLGVNGTTPTGGTPIYYLSGNGSGDSWTQQGSVTGMTLTGTLGTETSP